MRRLQDVAISDSSPRAISTRDLVLKATGPALRALRARLAEIDHWHRGGDLSNEEAADRADVEIAIASLERRRDCYVAIRDAQEMDGWEQRCLHVAQLAQDAWGIAPRDVSSPDTSPDDSREGFVAPRCVAPRCVQPLPFTVHSDCRNTYGAKQDTLTKWLYATYLLMSSKKGMSTQHLHRTLGVSLKSTWFLMHRIREALREGGSPFTPLGGKGKKVEIDETYVGGKEKNKHASKRSHLGTGGAGKEAVFALVERGGHVKSHHIPSVNAATLHPIITAQVDAATFVMTDDGGAAKKVGSEFALQGSVNHSIGDMFAVTSTRTQLEDIFRSLNAASVAFTIISTKNI